MSIPVSSFSHHLVRLLRQSLPLVTASLSGLALALLAPPSLHAVPAAPDLCEVMQPSGDTFFLRQCGDEYYSWHETEAGFVTCLDTLDRYWKYAVPVENLSIFEILPEARVGLVDPLLLGLTPHALPHSLFLRMAQVESQETMRQAPIPLEVPENKIAFLDASVSAEPLTQPPANIPVSGTKTVRNIVLLACFSNHWNTGASTVNAAYGRVAVNEYSNLFNQVNHTTDGAVGSVRDYYYEVSYSKLTVQSMVTVWVRLPKNEDYYGADSGATKDLNWLQMISHAIAAADAAGFDFSQGDSDGDGWVDCLTVLHSGHGQEVTGNPTTSIWSKQGELGSPVTVDGVKVKRCHTEPALRGLTTSTSIMRIGVICHEMGHFFGLSDLYDYSSRTHGIGDWGIMGLGCWNGSEGNRPAHFCAHSKYMLGFVRPTHVHTQSSALLARVEDNASILLLRDGMSNGEYFLLENRVKVGFDNDTSIYPGLLVYHVDSKSANNDSNTWAHPLVKIEEADGDDSLGGKTAESESGDVWTATSAYPGGFRDTSGNQTVNAMHYQTSFYKRSTNPSYYSYLQVTNFSAAGNVMSCDIQSLLTSLGNQTVFTTGHVVSWPPCSQATSYELQEGCRATLTGLADGAEDENAMYETWHLSGNVRRSSVGQSSGSYSYLMQYYDGFNWYMPVQSMTLKKAFKVNTGTSLSFYLMSHLHADGGYLKCEISNDSGNTWHTLGTYNGYSFAWAQSTFGYSALNAAGINSGDSCILRFVMNTEYGYGWSGFPDWGFAVDDISLTGAEISDYSGWTTLASNIPTPSYTVPPRTNGVYAYRVRAFANAVWQGYGTVGETTVILPTVTLSVLGSPMPEAGGAALVTATLSQLASVPVGVNLALTGTATATTDYTISAPNIFITAGTLSGSVSLNAVQDPADEPNETIIVDISSVINGEESGTQQVTATILDDDPPPGSFEEWAQNYCPGMPLATAFTNDRNADGVQNGFDYTFGPNLETNAPLLSIFMMTNTPVIDLPKQLPATFSYVDILIATKSNLMSSTWITNISTHAIDDASEPTNRCWFAPDVIDTNGFFKLQGYLK